MMPELFNSVLNYLKILLDSYIKRFLIFVRTVDARKLEKSLPETNPYMKKFLE